ncbi:uncharacterized protein LOC125450640 isoform X2 [Stegostoma tigrinum]|uniref:uncharacterized protein LOC125450640 isoform X2 n=1 Tax=Stegostoma tigrinum TaxID=3053191 RepID=UPI00286FBF01|nr:uncharacterized protein LOC125450640 isoform X2 [Stegostoma tigrinum]
MQQGQAARGLQGVPLLRHRVHPVPACVTSQPCRRSQRSGVGGARKAAAERKRLPATVCKSSQWEPGFWGPGRKGGEGLGLGETWRESRELMMTGPDAFSNPVSSFSPPPHPPASDLQPTRSRREAGVPKGLRPGGAEVPEGANGGCQDRAAAGPRPPGTETPQRREGGVAWEKPRISPSARWTPRRRPNEKENQEVLGPIRVSRQHPGLAESGDGLAAPASGLSHPNPHSAELSDMISDSEDEGHDPLGGKGPLRLYHRTKNNTLIPTLVQHLRPIALKPCYVALERGRQ